MPLDENHHQIDGNYRTIIDDLTPRSGPRALYRDSVEVDPAEIPLVRPDEHTMGGALDTYVAQRLPVDLLDEAFAAGMPVEVHGVYPRHAPHVLAGAALARRGDISRPSKAFNRIRPHYFTVPGPRRDRLVVAVPPGRDYVLHYASLVSHHVRALGLPPSALGVVVRYPRAEETVADWTGLSGVVEAGDRVLIGYVQELVPALAERGGAVVDRRSNEFYGCTRLEFPRSGEVVCALGVRFSFWGCISARLAVACKRLGATEVVYAGKLGTLTEPGDIYGRLFTPSAYLHVGPGAGFVGPAPGPPNGLLDLYPDLDTGVHMSVATVLEEDVKQRAYADRFGVGSIDNEIAQIALALAGFDGEGSAAFSAIHFATDYLRVPGEAARADIYNLTNHRREDALRRKTVMLDEVARRLASYYGRALSASAPSSLSRAADTA